MNQNYEKLTFKREWQFLDESVFLEVILKQNSDFELSYMNENVISQGRYRLTMDGV